MTKHLRFLFIALLMAVWTGGWAQTWEKTDLANLTSDDVFVIVDIESTGAYAMSNNKGTGSAPKATKVTLSADKNQITSAVTDVIKWTLDKNAGGYTFYPNGDKKKWLYTTRSNNGVRVGTNDAKQFEPYSQNGYIGLKNTTTNRYVGVYNKTDWRCYTSTSTNIGNTKISYFKYTAASTKTDPALSFANASVDVALEDKTTTVQTITTVEGFDGKITYESSNNDIATVAGTTINLIKEGEVDIIAKSDATETYAAGTASYKLIIKSNLKDPELAFNPATIDFDVNNIEFKSADHLNNPYKVAVKYSINPTSTNATINENTGVAEIYEPGEYTITATFAGDDTYQSANATFILNAKDMRQDATLVFDAESYNIDVNDGKFLSADHLKNPNTVAVKYAIDPASENVEITANGEVTVLATGEYTITATFTGDKTYKPATATCKLVVTDGKVVFYESFNKCDGTGGNDGQFSGDIATSKTSYDKTGWEGTSVKGAAQCIKIGVKKSGGNVTSPNITIDKVALLTFNLASWEGDNSNVTITISNGTLGYNGSFAKSFTLTPSDSKFDNVEMIVKASSPFTIDFSCSEGEQRFFLDEVKVTEIKAKPYTFDETNDNNIVESYENANVTLNRSHLVTDNWNTFCVPFAISAEEIAKTWGEGTELRTFDRMSGNTMYFKKVESIEAGKPYLVKPAKDTDDQLTFNGVQTVATNAEDNKVGEGKFYMVGTYNAIKLKEDGSNLFLTTENKFNRPIIGKAKMKGMRVYFEVPTNTVPAALRANIDGVETGINAINGIEGNTTAPVYNLQGQCVGNSLRSLAPGIYVQGGKKYVVK